MSKFGTYAIAAAIGLALGSAAYAQARHDEKPHGTPGKATTASDTPATDRAPGRHDERPHGTPKKKAPKKAEGKKAETAKQ